MFCRNCGEQLADNASFCASCGTGAVQVVSAGDSQTYVPGSAPQGQGIQRGTRLMDRYEIVCELGRGGMGVVYQAIDHARGANVALKTVPQQLMHDERAIANLKQEVNTALALTHENICRIYDFQECPEAKFITMELIDGSSLDRLLHEQEKKGEKGFPLEQVLEWLEPICAALDYAHGKNIVHRDLKPGNIIVARDGTVKISDFGLARSIRSSMSKFSREAMGGTMLYMGPEQILGKPTDASSDIYSLAMLTYELLAGKAPFTEAADITYCQLHESICVNPNLNKTAYEALLAATDKDARKRPKQVSAFLQSILEGVPTESSGSKEETGELEPGELRTFDDIEFVWIPPGTFTMGSPESEEDRGDDETQHQVTISHGFWLGRYAVTQSQWEEVMGYNPSEFKGDEKPVEKVSWNDCQEFIYEMNEQGSGPYRLPTEAEWEYACRSGTTSAFHYGSSLSSLQANFEGNYPYGGARYRTYRERTTSVGSFTPNALGVYDMHGNVWEWCQDWHGKRSSSSQTDPTGPRSGEDRVLRGGAWGSFGSLCRSAHRRGNAPASRHITYGFRVVRTQT